MLAKNLRKSARFTLLWVLPAIGTACFAGMAAGAEAAAPAQLEEVIVTAQKREESLKEVPISITAFTASSIAEMGMKNIVDVSTHTPNFTMVLNSVSNFSNAVSIRGIGDDDANMSSDTPIGVYIDGVLPNPHLQGNLPDLVDTERVEVLRGPQGTLYGRNTPAGAVNIISRKPSGEFGLDLTAGVGNYNLRSAHVGLDLPRWDLGDAGNLAVRVTGNFLKRDGWVHDVGPAGTGQWFDSRNRQAGRLALRWTASDALVVDYTYDFFNANELPPVVQLYSTNLSILEPYVQNHRSTNVQLGIGNCHPLGQTYGQCGDTSRERTFTHAVHATWTISPALTLKSISAYSGLYNDELADADGTPYAILDSKNVGKDVNISQEFNASGATDDGNLAYVGGVYYSHEHLWNTNPGAYGFGATLVASTFGERNDSKAAYGQVDWKPDMLDHKMTLTGGLRYTLETRELIDANYVYNSTVLLAGLPYAKKDYSKLTPAATIKYDFTDDMNAYARYAQGWRSGGFNGRAGTQEALAQPFKPEDAKSYEVGMKGSFFEKRLDYTTAVFFTKYDNLQIVQTEPLSNGGYASVNANVGKIDISGFELEVNALLTPSLKVSASYGYLDLNVKQYLYCVPTVGGACVLQNIGNNRQLYYTPRNNASLSIDYKIAETPYGNVKARVDANWRDAISGGAEIIKYRPFESDPNYIPPYGLVNGRLALEQIPLSTGRGEVSFWVKNMLNAAGPSSGANLQTPAVGLGYTFMRFLEPRTFGVDFSYHY